MTEIYKALEKAEKEKKRELNKESGYPRIDFPQAFPPSLRAMEKEEKEERQADTPDLINFGKTVSQQRLLSAFQSEYLVAEQFRKLRTYFIKKNQSQPMKTIMVTSALQGEGKSFVAANLAIGFAHDLQLFALLIDCDLRNPTLAKQFGLEKEKGIVDYLVGNEDVSKFLIKTELKKLSILTSGNMPENPAELIGSKRMESLVHELTSRYNDRVIIFDSTPILSTSDPGILAKVVDGIILVVQAGKTPRDTVQQAVASIGEEKLLGVVLNHLEFKSSGLFSHYFGSSGYYYGYGYGKRAPKPSRWKRFLGFFLRRHK